MLKLSTFCIARIAFLPSEDVLNEKMHILGCTNKTLCISRLCLDGVLFGLKFQSVQ